ncbi:hypothetical protein GOODEAATRI_025021 [Goodea atripinnis]|uniref:Secreted protein n=1 Tax=Goodea atripinnis TaxID=208336 RepID=A0ABV0MUY0_9TELE
MLRRRGCSFFARATLASKLALQHTASTSPYLYDLTINPCFMLHIRINKVTVGPRKVSSMANRVLSGARRCPALLVLVYIHFFKKKKNSVPHCNYSLEGKS